MKTTMFKRAILLLSSIAFISMLGFSQDQQDNDRKKLAQKVGLELTDSMTSIIELTTTQIDSVIQCNLTYTLALFTTDPLTEEAIEKFETNLEDCLKDVLTAPQYDLWLENRKAWLDEVKKNLPLKEEESPVLIDVPEFD